MSWAMLQNSGSFDHGTGFSRLNEVVKIIDFYF